MADGIQLDYTVVRPATGPDPARRCSSTPATTPASSPTRSTSRRFVEAAGRRLRLHRREPARHRLLGGHVRLLPAAGGARRRGGHRVDQPAAVVERPRRHDRQELPGHHPAVRRRAAAAGARRHRPRPLLRRRLPRRRPPRRHHQLRLLHAVELHRPAELRVPSTRPSQVAGGDPECVNGAPPASSRGLPTNPFVQLLQHPYDDALFQERSPDRRTSTRSTCRCSPRSRGRTSSSPAGRPTCSRPARRPGRRPTGGRRSPTATTAWPAPHRARRPRALLRPLPPGRGQRLGAAAPRAGVVGGRPRRAPRAPGWTTGLDHWSEAAAHRGRASSRRGRSDAARRRRARRVPRRRRRGGRDTYLYTPVRRVARASATRTTAIRRSRTSTCGTWRRPPGTAAAFTTDAARRRPHPARLGVARPLAASTAPDIDLQVTLTEVRPDGQEMFVQQGWLRASQRALDPARSTALRPFQTHQRGRRRRRSCRGEPVLARVEVFPFGHVFRAGSRLRVWVEAPTRPARAVGVHAVRRCPRRSRSSTTPPTRQPLVLPLVPERRRADRRRCRPAARSSASPAGPTRSACLRGGHHRAAAR